MYHHQAHVLGLPPILPSVSLPTDNSSSPSGSAWSPRNSIQGSPELKVICYLVGGPLPAPGLFISKIPRGICLSWLLGLLPPGTVPQSLSPGQSFCELFLTLGLSDGLFFVTRLRLCVLGKNTTDVMVCLSGDATSAVVSSSCSLLSLNFTYVAFFNRLKVYGNPASGASVVPFSQQHLLTLCFCVRF